MICMYCGQKIHRDTSGTRLLVDDRTGDWWCRANPSNGGDAAPHEEAVEVPVNTGIIGKTVQGVEIQEWAGRDTFKDTVTWDRTVITFTDGTTTQFDSWDGEVYDEYRAVFDDEGQPHRLVEETTECRHCGHGIGYDTEEGWVAPDAGFDREGGDGIWRDSCPDNHNDRIAAHEPVGDGETLTTLAAEANLSMNEAWPRLKGLTTSHITAHSPLTDAEVSLIRAALRPPGFTDCGCNPAVGHTQPCLLAPVVWPEHDTAPCVERGEHLSSQRHPQADCPTEPYRCTACGRPEDDCSKDPCAAVIKDRES